MRRKTNQLNKPANQLNGLAGLFCSKTGVTRCNRPHLEQEKQARREGKQTSHSTEQTNKPAPPPFRGGWLVSLFVGRKWDGREGVVA